MASTIIIPRKNRVSVSIPQEYIGKPVAITLALVSNNEKENKSKQVGLADKYRGVFSAEDAKSFINHTREMRNEWNSI